jgi:predicted lipoprotein with Yx(FWY)xxD motif
VTNANKPHLRSTRRWLVTGGLASVLVVAACGSSSPTASSSSTTAATTATTSAAASGSTTTKAPTGVTISAANVPGFGTVLVNGGDGKTLYMLTSEQGGKLTCTDENGCTKVWPDTELPDGVTSATAGPGVQASMLGTVKSAAGHLYPTYAGWPLYEFIRDQAAGQANGEGISSFGGSWYVLGVDGKPVTSKTAATSSSSSNGY